MGKWLWLSERDDKLDVHLHVYKLPISPFYIFTDLLSAFCIEERGKFSILSTEERKLIIFHTMHFPFSNLLYRKQISSWTKLAILNGQKLLWTCSWCYIQLVSVYSRVTFYQQRWYQCCSWLHIGVWFIWIVRSLALIHHRHLPLLRGKSKNFIFHPCHSFMHSMASLQTNF